MSEFEREYERLVRKTGRKYTIAFWKQSSGTRWAAQAGPGPTMFANRLQDAVNLAVSVLIASKAQDDETCQAPSRPLQPN